MGEINICGHNCVFPQVPHAILKQYGVSPRTVELAYKTPPMPVSILIPTLLNSMVLIDALARRPFFVEDGERTIVLLEHPNKNCMEQIEKWLQWTIGNQYLIICPYRVGKNADDMEHIETWERTRYAKTKYGARPLLGVAPPARTLPPIPDAYPEDTGAPIHRPNEMSKNHL